MNTNTLFRKIAQQKVFVIGDVMLDNYWFGHSERMSPEAPVPIVTLEKKETRLGGALNVLINCKALGAQVSILTVIGKDEEADTLIKLCKKEKIESKYIVQDATRITTTKARVISSQKHLLRIDHERTTKLVQKLEYKFIDTCLKAIQIEKPDVIILQDYNKGVLTPTVIKNIIAHAKEIDCLVAVDPKLNNFFAYKEVDIFKPNLKEVQEGLNLQGLKPSISNLKEIHHLLKAKLKHNISFITLSEKGVFVQQDKDAKNFKAHKRDIIDVSGAGDTVIGVASLVYSVTKDKDLMAQIANLAGGLVCERVGVVSINKKRLKRAIEEL